MTVEASPLSGSDDAMEDDQDAENMIEGLAKDRTEGIRRKRRLLRVDGDGRLPDPVLSTLSVNRNLG